MTRRLHRYLDRLPTPNKGGEAENDVDPVYPGDKAYARVLAAVLASAVVLFFKLLEVLLAALFSMLSWAAKSKRL